MPEEPTANDSPLELWAGVECTVNRVGDEYYDQLERNGHAGRTSDLELFARLGVRALRYPVLWERTAPDGIERADWTWADERMARLQELAVRPIVGLVHHGSGPRSTSLVDSAFPEKLAAYARAVAERYPWIDAYTPVNEPLTTARFSGLYGYWYPHASDDLTFARALLIQCRGVALSMRAVREVNPGAQLVQTEDLGKTFSTRSLAYQAAFENERRWLSHDLLCGSIRRGHPMWRYLRRVGISQAELDWFVANPCPPDIIGINHYLTSERFLDERTGRYPASTHGGNGRHTYADVEAVRVRAEGITGARALIEETWERYRLPVAVTEAHLGCTREEQLRWLNEVWKASESARRAGADVRAVTAWSLLGAYDWNSLLTRSTGHYEPGVFDLRASAPRPTALANMLCELAAGREPSHPVLHGPGWWRRLGRLQYPPVGQPPRTAQRQAARAARSFGVKMRYGTTSPILITGATGTLGRALARLCEVRGLAYCLLTRRELDIADRDSVERALIEYEPWAVINAAGYVRVDDAEREPAECRRENTVGPTILAQQCARRKVSLLSFSSDLVFDGKQQRPYVEGDAPAPLNVYGRSKAEAESFILEAHPSALVIRTSAFFGPWDEHNFVTVALNALAQGRSFPAADDQTISPTYVPDLAHACLDLLIDGERGVWHLANAGAVTWADLARRAAEVSSLDAALVECRPTESLGLVAPRPAYSALTSERGLLLPTLEDAIARYFKECETRFEKIKYDTRRRSPSSVVKR
jgi:dTDP-4-dehydrorhamnose reductase